MTFATNIKAARLAAFLSQEEAAEVIGVSVSTYRNWETGRTEPPLEPVMTQRQAVTLLTVPPSLNSSESDSATNGDKCQNE